MTDCPGYLGVTVNDRTENEETFRYDLLVSNHPAFNLTFSVPNWGMTRNDKTFEIVFDDAKSEFRTFLTSPVVAAVPKNPSADRATTTTTTMTNVLNVSEAQHLDRVFHWLTFFVVVFASIVYSVLRISLKLVRRSFVARRRREELEATLCNGFPSGNPSSKPVPPPPPPDGPVGYVAAVRSKSSSASSSSSHSLSRGRLLRSLGAGHRLLVAAYVVARFVRSVAFTFTVFAGIVAVCLRRDGRALERGAASLETRHSAGVAGLQRRVIGFVDGELARQANISDVALLACRDYADDVAALLRSRVAESSAASAATSSSSSAADLSPPA